MSLRARLVVVAALVLAAMAVTGAVVTANQRQLLVDQVDAELRHAGEAVGGMATVPPPRDDASASEVAPDADSSGALSHLWVGVVSPTGTVTQRVAPGLGPSAAPNLDIEEVRAAAAGGTNFDTGSVTGTTRFRLHAEPIGTDGTVAVVGMPLTRVDEATDRLILDLIVGAAVMTAVMGLLGWWVWRLGLRPIRRMTEAADAVRGGDSHRRVEDYPARTEAGRMAAALNTMLDERQAVEDGLRRFVGDASHELRTPLTSIRGYVELYRRGGLADDRALDDAMRRIAQEAARMNGMVDDLLLLVRLGQGRPIACEPVDLSTVTRDAASDAAVTAPQRRIDVQVDDRMIVEGDEERLRQVVAAVLDNALVHTRPTGSIRLRAHATRGWVSVEITDEGPGMTEHVADHARERFFRGDPARSRHRGGSGLGLAIVDSIVTSHGGRLTIDSAPDRGTTVRLRFARSTLDVPTEPPADVTDQDVTDQIHRESPVSSQVTVIAG